MLRSTLATLFLGLVLPATAQHDPGRDAVRLLARGKTTAAKELVHRDPSRRNSPISKADQLFVLALIACREGKPDDAFEHLRKAVAAGLPLSRLQAGPRQELQVLYRHPPYQEWIRDRGISLLHGPMLGAVTDRSARIWLRTAGESEVAVEIRSDASTARTVTGRTDSDDDFTAILSMGGLTPDTTYTYRVAVDGEWLEPRHEFRTFPKARKPAAFEIAFGGCSGFTPAHETIWNTMHGRHPLAFLTLGDNVYIDDPEYRLTQHYCYYRRQSQPDWRRLVASTSVHAIYDDHDFGTNDCVPGSDIETPGWKREVWKVFTQNWNNPSYGGGVDEPGCWHDFFIGDVHFIMLDTRYYRDREAGSMLGAVQKAWFLDTLKGSRGTFKVVASSVPWSPGVKPGSKDTWDGFAAEREEIFGMITEHRIDGVFFIAADRHRSDFRRTPRPGGYPLHEAMSARLTNVHTHPFVKNAKGSEFLMGYNDKNSFGLLRFDTTLEDPEITYRIVTIGDEIAESATLRLSEISFSER